MAGKKVNRLIVPNTYYVDGMAPVTSVNNILPVNGNVTIPIPTVPTNVSAFTNDAGYLTSTTLTGYATQSWVQQQGYLTSVPSQYITDTELATTLADYVTNSDLSATLNSYATVTDLGTETSNRMNADDSLQTQINNKYDASNPSGFISGISSADVITALGYTPYNNSNPNGYITSAALSNYVTNTDLSTTLAGYAQITDIPTVGNGTITINQGGVQKGTFTTNQSSNATIDIDAVGSVDSVNGQTGVVVLTASDVGALADDTVIPTVNNSTITLQQDGTTVDSFTLNQASNKTINIKTPDDYYTRDEIDSIVPQDVKTPVVYYQPTTSYCYDENDNRFYGSRVSEKLYLVQPKTSGTTQVIDMSTTFSLDFSFKYFGAPSSSFTLAEVMVSSASGKGVLLQVNSGGMYYRNNIASSSVTGTRSLVAGNTYDVRIEYNGTKMVISWKLSTDANYTQINATTCTISGTYYNYASIGSDGDSIYLPLSSVVLVNDGTTLYDYVAGKIALDYDETLTIDSNQLSVVVDQTYDGTSANPQSGAAIAGAGFLQNTATGSYALTILGTAQTAGKGTNVGYYTSAEQNSSAFGYYARATGQYAEVFGSNSTASGNWSITIGHSSTASGDYSIAIGSGASVSANRAIQLGVGANSTTNSLQIGFSASSNYILLDGTTGLIPDARISTNIARTNQIPAVPTNISAFINDAGYTTNVGTVTSVNNSQPDANGNVTLSIPTVPTNVSAFTNDSGYQTSSDVNTAVTNAISTLLSNLYPVGSVYIGTQSTCPLATLISGSTWELVAADRVLQGSSTNHSANTTVAAGLPDITGSIVSRGYTTTYSGAITGASGAFSYTRNGQSNTSSPVSVTGTAVKGDMTRFNASNSNSIYGSSTTVQPPAYVVNIWRRTA